MYICAEGKHQSLMQWLLLAHAAWPREEKFDTNIVEDDNTLIFTKNSGKLITSYYFLQQL